MAPVAAVPAAMAVTAWPASASSATPSSAEIAPTSAPPSSSGARWRQSPSTRSRSRSIG